MTLFGRIGVYSLVLFCLYLISQYMIFHFNPAKPEETQQNNSAPTSQQAISLKRLSAYFVIAAVATFGAGIWLAFIGSQISEITGLSTTLVGAVFLAICTSAPEMVVSISAVRLGALDMAVGNMVGSNLFNMGVIIFIDDLFYKTGPILQSVDVSHIATALFAILMSSIILIGLVFRPHRWLHFWMGPDTVLLAILYAGAILTLYYLGKTA
jgi:cation:H+ antiporter